MATAIKIIRNHPSTTATMPEPRGWRGVVELWKGRSPGQKVSLTAAAIALTIALGLTFRWYVFVLTHVSTDNATVESEILPVNSRMMGFVKSVLALEHAVVRRGDLLAEFDDSDLKIELSLKEARLKKAEADYNRAKRLIGNQAISAADLEGAYTLFTAAKADRDGTLLKLEFTKIRAQGDGTIAKASVHVGQFVQPGQSLFVMVAPEPRAWIRANFKETQIRRIKKGQSATITVDAYPSERWRGEVVSISPSSGSVLSLLPPENATGNFTKVVQRVPVHLRVTPRPGFPLRPGMSVTVSVEN